MRQIRAFAQAVGRCMVMHGSSRTGVCDGARPVTPTGQKKLRTSHPSGLLIDNFASPIEQHAARSSLMSLLTRSANSMRLCPCCAFLPRSTLVGAKIMGSTEVNVSGVTSSWRWWGAVEHTRDLPRGAGVGAVAGLGRLYSRPGSARRWVGPELERLVQHSC